MADKAGARAGLEGGRSTANKVKERTRDSIANSIFAQKTVAYTEGIPTAISQLLDRGRRRIATQLGWIHLTTALGVVFAMSILLLLFGTQILDWYWLPAVFAIGIGIGAWRLWKSMPTVYQVAQRIDHSLRLHDALSTAFHYGTVATEPSVEAVRAAQAKQAEDAARTVDLRAALPFVMPRTAYITAALALVALTMFGIRYGMTQSLDLKPSLVAMAFDNFFSGSDVVAKKDSKTPLSQQQQRRNGEDEFQKLNVQRSNDDRKELDPENAAEAHQNPESQGDPASDAKMKSKVDQQEMKAQGSEGEEKSDGEKGKSSPDQQGQQQSEAGDGKNDQSKEGQQRNAQQKGDNSSLMDKLKDAMSNMLNKMKGQQKGNQQQQQNQESASKDGSQQQQQGQKSGEQQAQQQQGQQSQGEAKDQNSEGKDGQQGQKSENAQGKASESKQSQQQSADAKSGQGKQDGSKDLKDAEDQRAMGKISELFGKRQQNLSGEVMIEVSSGKQQLKTQYTGNSASHKEAGGEINRDEVPLIYQQYVEKYFDQIRKADAAADRNANGPAATPKQPAPTTGNPARPSTGASH